MLLVACYWARDPNEATDPGSVPDAGQEPDAGTDPTRRWIDVHTQCGFGFRAPPNYNETPVQGQDSCVLQFAAGDCSYGADYGGFSGPIDENLGDSEYRARSTHIDREPATLVSFTRGDPATYVAGVHFPSVGQQVAGPKLTIVASCLSRDGLQDALALFRSIRFDE